MRNRHASCPPVEPEAVDDASGCFQLKKYPWRQLLRLQINRRQIFLT